MFKNKKSALDLSISTIVIVVIAFTLLGLALAFITKVFRGTGNYKVPSVIYK